MENKDFFIEEVNGLIEKKDFRAIAKMLSELQPVDIAESAELFSLKERAILFRLLPKSLAAEVFVELPSDMQEELILGFTDNELHSVLDELFVDDTVDIMEEMPASVVRRIVKNCPKDMREDINHILSFE